MKTPPQQTYQRPYTIAARWNVDRTTVVRIAERHGIAGRKTGKAKQCARLYSDAEVQALEEMMR